MSRRKYTLRAQRAAYTTALADGRDLEGKYVDQPETVALLEQWGYLPGLDEAKYRADAAKVYAEAQDAARAGRHSAREKAALDAAEAALKAAEAILAAMRAA